MSLIQKYADVCLCGFHSPTFEGVTLKPVLKTEANLKTHSVDITCSKQKKKNIVK